MLLLSTILSLHTEDLHADDERMLSVYDTSNFPCDHHLYSEVNELQPTAQFSSQLLEDSIVLRISLMALLVQLECLDHQTEGEAVVRVKYDARSFRIIEVQVGRD